MDTLKDVVYHLIGCRSCSINPNNHIEHQFKHHNNSPTSSMCDLRETLLARNICSDIILMYGLMHENNLLLRQEEAHGRYFGGR